MKNAGSKFGLNLVLDVQQYEYTSFLADQAGFMVLIHDQETPPMVEELGFSVGPGTSTFAAFTKQKVNTTLVYLSSFTLIVISCIKFVADMGQRNPWVPARPKPMAVSLCHIGRSVSKSVRKVIDSLLS